MTQAVPEKHIINFFWPYILFLVSVRNYSNNRVDAGGRAKGRSREF